MKKWTGVVLGAVLLAAGVLYILDVLGLVAFSLSLKGWWTLFIILPCLNGLITEEDKISSLAGLAVGILLLLAARGVFGYDRVWKLTVPLIVAALGLKLILHSLAGSREPKPTQGEDVAAFFGVEKGDYTGKTLTTAQISAVFGGTECNLTNATIQDGSHIRLYCAFGGVELFLPENVVVKNNAFCLFGGVSDKRSGSQVANGNVTLLIEGFCIFGGVDIK